MKFILSCAGPLSTDLNGIETFFRSVFDAQPARLDSTILDIPWREVPVKSTLRIGVVPESSIFPLHPPVRRVLAEAVRLLEAQGHQIIHLTEEECRIMQSNEIGWTLFGMDQGSKKHLESAGEPPVSAMHYLMKQAAKIMSFYKPTLPDTTSLDPLHKLALLNTHRAELREAYRKTWLQHDLDICIAPPAQTTAVLHDTFGVAPYTTLTNVLDVSGMNPSILNIPFSDKLQYPSCIIPFGEVGPEDADEKFTVNDNQLGAECESISRIIHSCYSSSFLTSRYLYQITSKIFKGHRALFKCSLPPCVTKSACKWPSRSTNV